MANKDSGIPSREELEARLRARLQSPDFKRAVLEETARIQREESVVEEAPWFGTTGLHEEIERELPRYLRREFGESLSEERSLRADQLTYLGRFQEGSSEIHYWNIPYGDRNDVFAYVEVRRDGEHFTSWGGRRPPQPDGE